jgi:hypothetical protein
VATDVLPMSAFELWMCPVVGLFGYIAAVCADVAMRSDPKRVAKMGFYSCALGATFFLINWLFALMSYGTSFTQMLAGQVPALLLQRTIFATYSVIAVGLLSLFHSLVVFIFIRRGIANVHH